MVVEISNEQKAEIAEKIELCVEFLKQEVQPHLVVSDKISVSVTPDLDLFITHKDLYVKETRVISLPFWEPCYTRTLYLEKPARKKSKKNKKYICDNFPEQAVEFLKGWEKAKLQLLEEVSDKIQKVDNLNDFINGFRL